MQHDIGWPPPLWLWVVNPYAPALILFASVIING